LGTKHEFHFKVSAYFIVNSIILICWRFYDIEISTAI